MSGMPEWTPPKTWSPGEEIRSADLNTYVRDNTEYLYGSPRVAVKRNNDQAVAHDDYTTITWEETVYDVGGWWDSASPNQVVVPVDGLYMFSIGVLWDDGALGGAGDREVRLVLDGDTLRAQRLPAAEPTEHAAMMLSARAAGDSFTVDVYQNSESASAVKVPGPGPTRSPVLIVLWVAPLDAAE